MYNFGYLYPCHAAAAAAEGRGSERPIVAKRLHNFYILDECRKMCVNPQWLRKRHQEVPCGRCYKCIKRRRNDWYIRCLIQSRVSKYTYFGLLTYAEVDQVLNKRDIQLFLKRLRSYGVKLSYLIVGEHGEKKDRPHWHCLFFSDSPISYRDISSAWHGGYEDATKVNRAGWIKFSLIRSARSIRYTVKYVYKYDGVDPRFILLASRNPAIGSSFLVNQRYFLENKTTKFSIDGRPMAMPRYYKRKIFDGYEDIKDEVNSALSLKVRELADSELSVARSLNPNLSDYELRKLIKQNHLKYHEYFIRKS